MDNVKLFSAFGALAVIAGLVAGGVVLHFAPVHTQTNVISGSSAGATFNTAKFAAIVWQPGNVGTQTNGAATTTSLFNGDASDRIITNLTYSCSGVGSSNTAYTGAGLASLIFTAATSSASVPNSITVTNALLNTNIATSSTELFVASTTPGLTGSAFVRRWAAGSYLTFSSNATNTATCAIGVNYIGT